MNKYDLCFDKGDNIGECACEECPHRNECDYADLPESCDRCEHSIENVEQEWGGYERSYAYYECKLCDGACNSGERMKDCPLREAEE